MPQLEVNFDPAHKGNYWLLFAVGLLRKFYESWHHECHPSEPLEYIRGFYRKFRSLNLDSGLIGPAAPADDGCRCRIHFTLYTLP